METTAVFRLFDFPAELCTKVFKSLIPDSLPIGTGLPLSTDLIVSRKTLFNLCLASRLCHSIALPLLYMNIIITDHVQMATLLVNLMAYHTRRGWIRNFALLADFPPMNYNSDWRNSKFAILIRTINWLEKTHDTRNQDTHMLGSFHDEVRTLIPKLLDLIMDTPSAEDVNSFNEGRFTAPDYYRWESYESRLYGVYKRLLQLVLQVQTNIEDILVTVPTLFAQHLSPAEWEHSIYLGFLMPPYQPPLGNHFKSLRSIRKQANPSKDVLLKDPIQPYFDPFKPEFIRSQHWELFRDDGRWIFRRYLDDYGWPMFEPQRDLETLSHVTKLGLYESKTHPAVLRMILSSCKSLKDFSYTTDTTKWTHTYATFSTLISAENEDDQNPVPKMQHALDEVRETLTDLRLGWAPQAAVLTEEEETALAPHRVDVSGFPHLKNIDIDPHFVRNDDIDDDYYLME